MPTDDHHLPLTPSTGLNKRPLPDSRGFIKFNNFVLLPSDEAVTNLLSQQNYAGVINLFEQSALTVKDNLNNNFKLNGQKLYETILQIRNADIDFAFKTELTTGIINIYETLKHILTPSINKSIELLLKRTRGRDPDYDTPTRKHFRF